MKVNIVGNIRSLHQFHYPTKVYKRELLELGIDTQYYFDVLDKQIYSCDVLIFSEENYRNLLPIKNKDREHSIEFLKQYLGRFPKVIWFDGHDGSGWLRSYVFPFIDKYTKSSLMKDTSYYKEKHTIGIAHRDYVSETHEIDDPKSSKEVLTDNDLTKLTLSWNYAYKNWNHLINNWFFMNRPTIGRILNKFVKDTYKLTYTDPNLINRGKILQYRMNYWPKYGTVKWWREQTLNHIKEVVQTVPIYQLQSTDRVKKQQFIKEIKNSVVTVSPFGLGEMCYRDFESFIHGSLLFKPSMDHIQTFPDLYIDEVTYISHKWDFSDFNEKLEDILVNPKRYEEIAREGQSLFRYALSDGNQFASHFYQMIS